MNAMSKIKTHALPVLVASALAAGGIGMLSQPASAKVKTPKTLKKIVQSVPNERSAIDPVIGGLILPNLGPTARSVVLSGAGTATNAACSTAGPSLLPPEGSFISCPS